MSKFWIGTVEEYKKSVEANVMIDESVKRHSPIYSSDGSEVLVKGIGDMTAEDVKAYKSESNAWAIEKSKLPEEF